MPLELNNKTNMQDLHYTIPVSTKSPKSCIPLELLGEKTESLSPVQEGVLIMTTPILQCDHNTMLN